MAVRSDKTESAVVSQSGRPVFMQQLTLSAAATRTDLVATTAESVPGYGQLPVPRGALLLLQPSVDMNVRLVAAGATAGASANNSVKVLANQQYYVYSYLGDGALDFIAGGAGVCNVFFVI